MSAILDGCDRCGLRHLARRHVLSCCCSRPLPSPRPLGAAGRAGAIAPPLSPRNANYTIDARARSREPHDHRLGRRSPGATSRTKPATELQFHLYWNAWRDARSTWHARARRSAAARRSDRAPRSWARIDVTVDRAVARTRPRRPDAVDALHRARRRQRGRPDGDGGAAADGRSRRRRAITVEVEVDRARAAHVRAHRRHRQLLLHRAVVSEARRAAGRAAGTAISSTPAPSSSPTSASTTCR